MDSPDYRSVCDETTGHAEVAQISFDPKVVSYEELVDFFFRMHDPTTPNRQGPDVGSQYRSMILYHSPSQKIIAEELKERFQEGFYKDSKVVTEVVPMKKFWDAETYHQHYLEKNPWGYECPSHFVRTSPQL